MALALLLTQALCYRKVMCICPDTCGRTSIPECKGHDDSFLDPTSQTFADDFAKQRNNIKDLDFYFINYMTAINLTFDLRIFKNLNITFWQKSYNDVFLNFNYISNDDYLGTKLFFDEASSYYMKSASFIPINANANEVNILKIGTIIAPEIEEVNFYKLNDNPTKLLIKDINLRTFAFENITKVQKLENGNTQFKIPDNEMLDMHFSKEATKITVGNKEVEFASIESDNFRFEGNNKGWDDFNSSLKLTIDDDLPNDLINKINITDVTNIIFNCKFLPPSATNPIRKIQRVGSITFQGGDFPFTIRPKTKLLFKTNGNTTIYGEVTGFQSYDAGKMRISTDSTDRIYINFKGDVTANLLLESPYIDANLVNYIAKDTSIYSDDFPITFSFNEKAASHVYIEKIDFPQISKVTLSHFICFPTITTQHTDEGIQKYPNLRDGFVFLDIPATQIDISSFVDPSVDSNSPSSLNNIPGFTKTGTCIGLSIKKAKRAQFSAKVVKSAFGAPTYICITDKNFYGTFNKCKSPLSGEYIFVDVLKSSTGDYRSVISSGFKNIIISSTLDYDDDDDEILINFDIIEGDGYNVTIYSSASFGYSTFITIKAALGKIKYLNITKNDFGNDQIFNMEHVTFQKIGFCTTKTYKFNEKTNLMSDIDSLDNLNKIKQKFTIPKLTLFTDPNSIYRNDFITELAEIDSTSTKLCSIGHDKYGEEKKCATVQPNFITDLVFKVRYPLTIDITNIDKTYDLFRIELDPVEKSNYKRYQLSLTGNGWETTLDKKLAIDFKNIELNVTVNMAGQTDNINFIGTGSKIFTIEYDKTGSYCLYSTGASVTCHDKDPSAVQLENNASLADELSKITKNSVTLEVDVSTSPLKIQTSIFDKKKVILKTTKDSATKEEVEIEQGKDFIDEVYSYTVFEDIKTVYKGSTEATISFGQLELKPGYEVDAMWNQYVHLNVSQIVCSYADLQKFSKVTVNDQITLTGEIPTSGRPVSVDFTPDEDANDLISEIGGDVKITLGKEMITLGLFSFKITHSKNYDAYFTVIEDSNITIDCSNSEIKYFPKFVIDTGKFNCYILFTGSYPPVIDETESLILLKGHGLLDVSSKITGTSLPISISGYPTYNIRTSTKLVDIYGPIDFNVGSNLIADPPIKFYSSVLDICTVNLLKGINIVRTDEDAEEIKFIGLMSGNLIVNLQDIKYPSQEKKKLQLFSTISKTGSSKLVFKNKLVTGLSFSGKTYIVAEVYGDIDNEAEYPYISQPEVIIEADVNDIAKLNLSLYYILPETSETRTHGFSPMANCLALNISRIDETKYGVNIFAEVKPSELPFVMDFTTNESSTILSEFLVKPSNIDVFGKINTVLPKVQAGILLRLHDDLSSKFTINLDVIKTKTKIVIESIGNKPCEVYTTIPNNNQLSISYLFVKLGFSSTKSSAVEMVAAFANFTDCQFLNPKSMKVTSSSVKSLALDVDSLNGLVMGESMTSFKNPLSVNSVNMIIFTKEGWEFREDRTRPSAPIKAADYTDVIFETRMLCTLTIADPSLTSIHGFKFVSYPEDDGKSYFEISRNWGSIKDLGNLKINVSDAEHVVVDSSSYPVPDGLFGLPKEKITYRFMEDGLGKFDANVLKDDYLYKDETFTADFQFLQKSEHKIIHGNDITFAGNTNFIFKDDIGEVKLVDATIEEKSRIYISNLEIVNGLEIKNNAQLTTSLNFGLSSKIRLHWRLGTETQINHTRMGDGYPETVEIIYDDSQVDKELFNQQLVQSNGLVLMKGDFDCISYKIGARLDGSLEIFKGDSDYLTVICDTSSDGQVLVLKGVKEIPEENNADSAEKKGRIGTGGVVGIVIAIAVAVGVVVAIVVYRIKQSRIDELEREIPEESAI